MLVIHKEGEIFITFKIKYLTNILKVLYHQ